MQTTDRNSRPTIERDSLPLRIAGHSARPTRVSHSSRPTNRKICQKRPRSTYSQPWWPNQKFLSRPSFCITASHCPANEPTTMTMRQVQRTFTPRRWNFGSCPEIAGPMYRPMPSHAVAIHSTASCVCQGARERVGQDLGQGEAVGFLAFDLIVRGGGAQQDLDYNSAITTQKYLAVARMDGVTLIEASGSDLGSTGAISSPWLTA